MHLLVIISSDPRQSARPAEAIRIAAGVGAWKRAQFTVVLRGPGVLALSEFADELVDSDNFERYLPMLRDPQRPILVQAGAPALGEIGEAPLPFKAMDDTALAELAARADAVMHF